MIENRQKLIKEVVKIVVENKKPKKLIKKRKNELRGGRKREGSVKVAWGKLGVWPRRIDIQAPGPVVHTLLIPRSHTPDDLAVGGLS